MSLGRREEKLLHRRGRAKKALLISLIPTVLIGAAFGSWLNAAPAGGKRGDIITQIKRDLLSEEKVYGDPVNLVLVGSDSRRGESARSDTLIFMRIDFNNNRVYLVSIPRDMRVYIPGRGNDKVNAAYAYGQAPLAIRTVESFLGVDLNHYVEVDFRGFKKLVDALGGIDITVNKAIIDRTRQFSMHIPKGPQHMNGETALNYVRYRHGDSDFERAARQQSFLRALAANTFKVKSIFKLPQLIGIFEENVGTDMTKRELLTVGGFMRDLPKNRIETITLPGKSIMSNGVSYVEPDRSQVSDIMEKIESGKSIKKMKTFRESGKMSRGNGLFGVAILNGTGKPGLARRAKGRLIGQGFRVVRVGDAEKFNYSKTEIRYDPKRRAEAFKVRRLFFGEAVMTPASRRSGGDIEVVLGSDYYKYDRSY